MSEQSLHDDVIPNGEEIVERFGGIRPMAAKLNVPVTTVQGWKKRDAIPAIRRDEILSAASHYDIDLKGLISESANQNTRSGTIAEDPALAARTAPAPQAAPQRPAQPAATSSAMGVDMRQIKRAARNTSFLTTVAMLAVAGAVAFVFFGGPTPPQDVRALEGRVTSLEQRGPVEDGPGIVGQSLAMLQEQVKNLSVYVGVTPEELAAMARNVAAGSGAPLTQRLAVLEQQLRTAAGTGVGTPALSGLVERMEGMAASPQGAAELQAAIADLRTLVTGLQGRTDQIDAALSEAKTENDALARTLTEVSGRDLGAAAMLLVLTQLRQSIDRQTPFAEDLALLRDVAAGQDAELASSIERLAPHAETGILSPGALKRELQGSANDIISAKLSGEDVSVKDKIMSRLQGLFSVKKDGVPVTGGPERALIDQASKQLDAGDVAGAMATLRQLEGPAAQAAQPWQEQAAATLAAQALDGQLVNAIIAKVKSGMGGNRVINLAPQQPLQQQPQAPQAVAPVAPEAAPETPITPAPFPGTAQGGSPVIIQQ